jgi:hypothetical protein
MDTGLRAGAALPEDHRTRQPAIASPEGPALVHLAVVGDTYAVLPSGEQTSGRFEMHRRARDAERKERRQRAIAKAPEYGMEIFPRPVRRTGC